MQAIKLIFLVLFFFKIGCSSASEENKFWLDLFSYLEKSSFTLAPPSPPHNHKPLDSSIILCSNVIINFEYSNEALEPLVNNNFISQEIKDEILSLTGTTSFIDTSLFKEIRIPIQWKKSKEFFQKSSLLGNGSCSLVFSSPIILQDQALVYFGQRINSKAGSDQILFFRKKKRNSSWVYEKTIPIGLQ